MIKSVFALNEKTDDIINFINTCGGGLKTCKL